MSTVTLFEVVFTDGEHKVFLTETARDTFLQNSTKIVAAIPTVTIDEVDCARELCVVIRKLLRLLDAYEQFNEDEKKSIRHLIYSRTGQYGKTLTPTFDALKAVKAKVEK